MGREEDFDSFYRATRAALVHQTFALTGDMRAAQGAVRDAYVAAWHHWRKVSASEDPLGWVRPHAWQLAQRRHSARIWHRNKGLPAEVAATLEAVSKLPAGQRRILLLTELAGLEVGAAARELGLPPETAVEQADSASSALATKLEIDVAAVPVRLRGLESVVRGARLPRASIVRRAGRKRRRAHTAVAAAAATVVAIASGAFAYQPEQVQATDLHLIKPPSSNTPTAPPDVPTADDLLDQDQISRLGAKQPWQVLRTEDNTSGDGINTVCQQARFADPDGDSALVREFAADGKPPRSAVQTVEVSESEAQAERAFSTTVGWYAGCHAARLQLLRAYQVGRIGDQAHVLMLRAWQKPVTTYSVAVARVGRVVTSTVGKTVGGPPPPPQEITQSLADAVAMLCSTSGADDCSRRPTYKSVPPPPSGEEPGILAVVDLPPVGRLEDPWVGTRARPARDNPSATTCDRADFDSSGAKRTRSRTFLIPGAKLPDRFGLSETYGEFAAPSAARRFIDKLRKRLDGCEDHDLSTKVHRPRTTRDPDTGMEMSTWRLETEVSNKETVEFRLGFVRVRDTVAQVTFSPTPEEDMSGGDFTKLVERAGDRLRELD